MGKNSEANPHLLQSIFPDGKDIPEDFLYSIPVDQHDYLVNGELRAWDGPMQEVFSPVCVQTESGTKQKPIGGYPLFTEKESLEIVDAAVSAYSIRTLVATKEG